MVLMGTTRHDSTGAQLWAEARRSVTIGIGVLVAAFTCFGLFVSNMPPLGQERQDVLLHNFPPKNLQGLILLRDTLFDYAETHPVGAHAASRASNRSSYLLGAAAASRVASAGCPCAHGPGNAACSITAPQGSIMQANVR